MVKKEEVKDLATVNQTTDIAEYGDSVREEMKELLDNMGFFKLPEIKVLKDSPKFVFDEDDERKEITGVLLHAPKTTRALWPNEYGKGSPEDKPLCNSYDGKFGNYGPCDVCQKNKLSKTYDGQKPMCSTSLPMFVVLEGESMPRKIKYGATSIKHWKAFAAKYLIIRNITPMMALIKFSLTMEENVYGKNAVGKFELVRILSKEEYTKYKQMAAVFESAMAGNASEEVPE